MEAYTNMDDHRHGRQGTCLIEAVHLEGFIMLAPRSSGFGDLHLQLSNYTKVKGISVGGWGSVDLYEHNETEELVAIKFIERGDKITKNVERQILHHHGLLHPHVVHLEEVILTDTHIAIVMEYVDGSTLQSHMDKYGSIEEEEARWYFQQLAIALDYLHRKEITSRDVKLENVLMSFEENQRPLLKLTGFGCSKHERYESAPVSLIQSVEYMPPEVIAGGGKKAYCGKAADIWALGIILFRLVAGFSPFVGKDLQDDVNASTDVKLLTQNILNGRYELPAGKTFSTELRQLLDGLLESDPAHRMSLKSVLKHPWFLEGLPEGVADMNQYLPDSSHFGQTCSDIKGLIKQAKCTVEGDSLQPHHPSIHKWDDSHYDDHQLQYMDADEVNDFFGLNGQEYEANYSYSDISRVGA